MLRINSTYKARDVEEWLDIVFYRPFGYLLALAAKSMKMTPNMVTFLCMMFGVIAGRLFYYHYFYYDVLAIFLLIFSEALDSADGQLARMTQKYSRLGRVFDGLATNFTFLSIYINLCLRMIHIGTSDSIFLLAVVCGMSHSIQSAVADFYRNAYLMIVHDKGEFDTFKKLNEKYQLLQWRKAFVEKLIQKLYLNYTKEQESLTKSSLILLENLKLKFGNELPAWFKEEYKKEMYPLLKYYNILTTNTRMIALFVAVLMNNIMIYFLFELVILNLLLMFVVPYQNKLSEKMNHLIIPSET
jgi:phosphatidylglycerophosphate synthase